MRQASAVARAVERAANDLRRATARIRQLRVRPLGGPRSVAVPALGRLSFRSPHLPRLTDARRGPLAVLAVVLLALIVAAVPSAPVSVGHTDGAGAAPAAHIAALQAAPPVAARARPDAGIHPDAPAASSDPSAVPYGADGTLVAPWAIDPEAAPPFTMTVYVVVASDTLTGIASHFGLNMKTIWWANQLTDKDVLVGQELNIPPVDGVVYTVVEGDTLASVAAATSADPAAIATFNHLASDELTAGQQLMIPDGVGAPLPTAAPTAAPTARPTSRPAATTTSTTTSSSAYHGLLAWPVPGGYISQYFHYGHYALDIAAPYGTPVLAAASGVVEFAGWRDNGGGWQVWLSNGGGIWTAYYHMSSLTVVTGQTVGRLQQIGRIGMTGWATGPHCHFEVWIGGTVYVGHRVNPLLYL